MSALCSGIMVIDIQRLRRLIRRIACELLGRPTYYALFFRRRHGYWPHLRAPTTLNAKLLWTSLYADLEPLSTYVDKVAVREYVSHRIGTNILVPILAVSHSERDLPSLQSLPQAFVAKATHGSHMTLVVRDKRAISEERYRTACCGWLKSPFSQLSGERVYARVPPAVVIEPLLADPDTDLLDYKFLCYDGTPLYVDVHGHRFTDHREDIYTVEWHRLPMTWGPPRFLRPVERPAQLDEMTEVAERLAAPFSFVRVDLYCTGGRVYFGELTFIPGNARDPIRPYEYDLLLGKPFRLMRSILQPDRCKSLS